MKRYSMAVGYSLATLPPHVTAHPHDNGEWVLHSAAAAEIASLRDRAEKAEADRDEARRFGEDAAAKYNSLISSGPTLTCAFCGEAFPPGTPASQHEALTSHVGKCEKHPMRKAEARVAVLTVDKEFARKNIGFEGVGVSDDKVSIQCRCCAMLWLVPAADFHGGKFDMRFPSEFAANPLPEAKQ